MDFDSSSKFISSLAKFLQSLCNGYVEFNSGVEVIGHIYLNVDTGKKIDYILNEKVCKTDENSVTFISNSFHAQPAERPKPTQKGFSDSLSKLDVIEAKVDEDEIIIMDEPESKNVGTLPPPRDRFHRKNNSPFAKVGRPPKRPHSQNFSSLNKHLPKQRKPDPPIGPNGAQHDVETLHTDSVSSFVTPQLSSETSLTAATDSDISHLSKVFPQTFNDSSNNPSTSEERDIKPQLDSDMNIVQVKQEINQSEHAGEEDQETYDESQDQSVFPGMPYDQYYADGTRRGQRTDYGPGGLSHDFFQGNAGSSGDGVGDTSGSVIKVICMSRKKGTDDNKQKRKAIRTTIELKKKIIAKFETGARLSSLAREFQMPRTTIASILKKKEAIKSADASNGVTILAAKRAPIFENMEKQLLVWISEMQMTGDSISETIICEKAKQLFQDLQGETISNSGGGLIDFKASPGWFRNFKKRSGIYCVYS